MGAAGIPWSFTRVPYKEDQQRQTSFLKSWNCTSAFPFNMQIRLSIVQVALHTSSGQPRGSKGLASSQCKPGVPQNPLQHPQFPWQRFRGSLENEVTGEGYQRQSGRKSTSVLPTALKRRSLVRKKVARQAQAENKAQTFY